MLHEYEDAVIDSLARVDSYLGLKSLPVNEADFVGMVGEGVTARFHILATMMCALRCQC